MSQFRQWRMLFSECAGVPVAKSGIYADIFQIWSIDGKKESIEKFIGGTPCFDIAVLEVAAQFDSRLKIVSPMSDREQVRVVVDMFPETLPKPFPGAEAQVPIIQVTVQAPPATQTPAVPLFCAYPAGTHSAALGLNIWIKLI